MENALQLPLEAESKIARSMVKILSNSSANSAVPLLNGFAGEILTSVSRVTSGNAVATTFRGSRKINFRSAMDQANAH